ncbi:TonB-dependent receptor [Pseudorhodoferax sp. Leaf274]|uniref:TonB-dependent receptor n=1 Tax=Pseudorhodoferax sp. Leaf274 TaxID=1736318 RepID=UPI000703BAD9|nr:TonB-dependent receptor [Pseudorhodoferax sp. Leaf274]KQP37901.1 TonB-dependent receptor [Pseudorhodoferax sp. Leaf274]
MRTARFRFAPLALAAAVAAALAATAPPAAAQAAAPVAIAIPSQPLAQALNELARQANLQMSFPAALVAGKTAPAVSGQLTPRAALDRLLAGSGLVGVVEQGAVIVRAANTGTALPTVEVKAAADAAAPPPVYAGGQTARGGRAGLLGNRDTMDTAFSVTQYTAQLIEDQQAQNIGDILVNDPSVRNTYARGAGRDEFNIRGFTLFNYDVSFNGLYGLSPRNASSLIGVERVEVLRGPNALLNGMAPAGSVGGAVNLVPKRAGATPLNRVTLSTIDDGQFGTHLDLGRRFGADQQLGVRVNALHRSGDTPVDHSSEKLDAVTLGLDLQGERFRIEADLNHQNRTTRARSSLLFPPEAGIAVGPAPDAKRNFLEEWTFWKAKETSALVRAEVDVAPDVKVYGAVGRQTYDFASLQTSSLMLNTEGDIVSRPARLDEYVDTTTAEAGIRGKLSTGALRHEPVLGLSTYNLDQGTLRATGALIRSNIYDPTPNPRPNIALAGPIPKVGETRLRSVALVDTVSFDDGRFQVTLGARRQSVETTSFNGATGAVTTHYDKSAVTPVATVLFKASPALSFYGNYIEGLSQGPTAPTGAANAGEIFAPGKSKQHEVGAKYDAGNFVTTLSVFQIERPNGFLNPATQRFGMDGLQRNRGVELLTQGQAMAGLRLLGGAAYTDGKLDRTEGGENDGRTAPATPKLQLNAAGEWDASFLEGLTLTARAVRTSAQYVDAANTQRLPAWTRFDLGARYRFSTGAVPITLRATMENVANKNYWLSAAREGLTVGAPRTLLVSLTADF